MFSGNCVRAIRASPDLRLTFIGVSVYSMPRSNSTVILAGVHAVIEPISPFDSPSAAIFTRNITLAPVQYSSVTGIISSSTAQLPLSAATLVYLVAVSLPISWLLIDATCACLARIFTIGSARTAAIVVARLRMISISAAVCSATRIRFRMSA